MQTRKKTWGANILGRFPQYPRPHGPRLNTPPASETAVPGLDPVAALRWRRRARSESPWLHEEVATRMAEQSRAEAELAMARSQMTKALIVNQEMRDSTESLKQEMQRNTGVTP